MQDEMYWLMRAVFSRDEIQDGLQMIMEAIYQYISEAYIPNSSEKTIPHRYCTLTWALMTSALILPVMAFDACKDRWLFCRRIIEKAEGKNNFQMLVATVFYMTVYLLFQLFGVQDDDSVVDEIIDSGLFNLYTDEPRQKLLDKIHQKTKEESFSECGKQLGISFVSLIDFWLNNTDLTEEEKKDRQIKLVELITKNYTYREEDNRATFCLYMKTTSKNS